MLRLQLVLLSALMAIFNSYVLTRLLLLMKLCINALNVMQLVGNVLLIKLTAQNALTVNIFMKVLGYVQPHAE